MPATSSNLPPTRTVLLHPVGGIQADGSQLFEVVEPAVPMWVSTTSYQLGNQVTGSDGKVYVAKVATKNVNPVGDAAVHWLNLW
jgi:hypothetical protein